LGPVSRETISDCDKSAMISDVDVRIMASLPDSW
jgi:hypothetical protein